MKSPAGLRNSCDDRNSHQQQTAINRPTAAGSPDLQWTIFNNGAIAH